MNFRAICLVALSLLFATSVSFARGGRRGQATQNNNAHQAPENQPAPAREENPEIPESERITNWPRVAAGKSYKENSCMETGLSTQLLTDKLSLFAKPKATGVKKVKYCLGGEDECKGAAATWKEADKDSTSGNEEAYQIPITNLPSPQYRLLTLESSDAEGKPCYASVLVKNERGKGFLIPIKYSDARLYEAAGLAEINRRLNLLGLKPKALDRELSRAAAINSAREAQGYGPHNFTVGWQSWSGGHSIEAAVGMWFDEGPGPWPAHGHYTMLVNPNNRWIGFDGTPGHWTANMSGSTRDPKNRVPTVRQD